MDRTSKELAERFGITMKAVRDVWNLRTWTAVTMPFWTPADQAFFLARKRRKRQRKRPGSLPRPALRHGRLTERNACGLPSEPHSAGDFNAVEHAAADLARGNAEGTFIDGWAIPRIQWLTPPDIVFSAMPSLDATAELKSL